MAGGNAPHPSFEGEIEREGARSVKDVHISAVVRFEDYTSALYALQPCYFNRVIMVLETKKEIPYKEGILKGIGFFLGMQPYNGGRMGI